MSFGAIPFDHSSPAFSIVSRFENMRGKVIVFVKLLKRHIDGLQDHGEKPQFG